MKNSIENKLNARLEKISRDNYMDYFGIADITSPQVQDFIRAQGGDVVLLKLTPEVRSIIELTRLHRVFEIFDDLDAAIAKLKRV